MLNKINFNYSRLPLDIINEIADYHDYEKYCKPDHKKRFDNVINDIISMSGIMEPISAKLAKECWGTEAYIHNDEYILDILSFDDDFDIDIID